VKGWLDQCHFGDVRAVLRRLVAERVRVNCIVTSPPYWGLRSYLPVGHPDKIHEIGSEPTLAEFLATLVDVFDLCRQVLVDNGTMWVNMGDSYAGSRCGGNSGVITGAGRDESVRAKLIQRVARNIGGGPQAEGLQVPRSDRRVDGLKPKDLVGQPWRLALALQDAGWWLRQDIIWHKPAPMPESVRDRFTKAHEYLFLLTKSERYHWDFEAMQEPASLDTHARYARGRSDNHKYADGGPGGQTIARSFEHMRTPATPSGWATGATGRKHDEKVGRYSNAKQSDDTRVVDAEISARMGRGAGWRKSADHGSGIKNNKTMDEALAVMPGTRNKRSVWTIASEPYKGAHFATFPSKLVEPCILAGCPPGGVVLDPFFGSGTVGQVAQQLGRRWIGIELNESNRALQDQRLQQPGLMLEAA
jgi:DNA modification methylase